LFADAQESPDFFSPQLLIKIPTRSRPIQFFNILDQYYEKLSGEIPYHFLITCDTDDLTMNCSEVKERLATYPNLTITFNPNQTKVEAYNCGIEDYVDWFDILLVGSDDMIPVVEGYDKIIAHTMLAHFPDMDGVLNFHDGYVGEILNTLPILGKKYYQRFGYAYHPAYHALWCDNELTLVSRMLGKEAFIDQVIIRHKHPIYEGSLVDTLLKRNEAFYLTDRAIFERRRSQQFDLDENLFKQVFTKDWSILICTLKERENQFSYLYNKLKKQVQEAGLEDKVEILFFLDDREHSIGFKRNALLRQSRGLYINYIDDDDDVHEQYVKMIYEKLQSYPDCVSLMGIITINDTNPKTFIHSLRYRVYFQKDGVYYRPPNHLNPIKRSLASQFLFPNQSYSEDTDWAMQIAKSGILKTEEVIKEPYYFYRYLPNK
jgi:hypothetical protein